MDIHQPGELRIFGTAKDRTLRYSQRMAAVELSGTYRCRQVPGAVGTWSLHSMGNPGHFLVIGGLQDGALPPVTGPCSLELPDAGRQRPLLLGGQDVAAIGIDRLETFQELPGLFAPLLAAHALRPGQRRLVTWLLKALKLPGGAWLLRTWQERRR